MATYNGAAFIEEQLQSLLAQSRLPDELVVCDDGSSDATVEILRAFALRAPFPVHIYESEDGNLGYAQNFSKALTLCRGEIVFLSDQDDVWLPSKIEKMLARFSSDAKLQVLIHDLEFCKADLSPIGQTKIQRMSGAFDLERQYVVGMATAIRYKFLQLCLPIPETGVTHDSWLHQCAWAIQRKGIIHEVLALYRRHASNVTADGDLNVDFVTTSEHFRKKPEPTTKFRPTRLSEAKSPALLDWLQVKRQMLVMSGFASAQRVDELIAQERNREDSLSARTQILAMNRLRRVIPVLKLLMRGGYKHANGWKSAIKDVLLN